MSFICATIRNKTGVSDAQRPVLVFMAGHPSTAAAALRRTDPGLDALCSTQALSTPYVLQPKQANRQHPSNNSPPEASSCCKGFVTRHLEPPLPLPFILICVVKPCCCCCRPGTWPCCCCCHAVLLLLLCCRAQAAFEDKLIVICISCGGGRRLHTGRRFAGCGDEGGCFCLLPLPTLDLLYGGRRTQDGSGRH